LDTARTQPLLDTSRWQKTPITAVIGCSDTPIDESTSCACSPTVDISSSQNTAWSQGVPDSVYGADLMTYVRNLSTSVSGQTVRVIDTAGNQSDSSTPLNISIDTDPPIVTITPSGGSVTIEATDNLSKIWKTAPTTSGIIYKKIAKTLASSSLYDENCGVLSPIYASISDASPQSVAQATTTLDTANQVLSYCVQDNAGNVTRGIYPSELEGCFSASNMSIVPNFSNYQGLLKTRLDT